MQKNNADPNDKSCIWILIATLLISMVFLGFLTGIGQLISQWGK